MVDGSQVTDGFRRDLRRKLHLHFLAETFWGFAHFTTKVAKMPLRGEVVRNLSRASLIFSLKTYPTEYTEGR